MVNVRRADPAWICFRGGENLSERLVPKTVVIIGCGSLGADIAYLIAKAGVGRLVLIDHDVLLWDNIGRHLLGANSVGQSKAAALQKFLQAELPHLNVTTYHETWETVYQSHSTIIASSDLVITTTGDWPSEAALNVVVRLNLRFPPTLFGWMEQFGCAGHALLVTDVGGCLACGMDELGHFRPSVCVWPKKTKTFSRAPGCADFFQPYGSIRISSIKSMIAEMAIDVLIGHTTRSELRTWIDSFEYLKNHKGAWNEEWIQRYGDPRKGELRLTTPWPIASTCPLCH
jgi:hypothetical protein